MPVVTVSDAADGLGRTRLDCHGSMFGGVFDIIIVIMIMIVVVVVLALMLIIVSVIVISWRRCDS